MDGDRRAGRMKKIYNQCLRRIRKRKTESGTPDKKKLIHEDLINQERKRV